MMDASLDFPKRMLHWRDRDLSTAPSKLEYTIPIATPPSIRLPSRGPLCTSSVSHQEDITMPVQSSVPQLIGINGRKTHRLQQRLVTPPAARITPTKYQTSGSATWDSGQENYRQGQWPENKSHLFFSCFFFLERPRLILPSCRNIYWNI